MPRKQKENTPDAAFIVAMWEAEVTELRNEIANLRLKHLQELERLEYRHREMMERQREREELNRRMECELITVLHKTEEERQKDMWNLRDVQRQIVLNGYIDTSAKKEK